MNLSKPQSLSKPNSCGSPKILWLQCKFFHVYAVTTNLQTRFSIICFWTSFPKLRVKEQRTVSTFSVPSARGAKTKKQPICSERPFSTADLPSLKIINILLILWRFLTSHLPCWFQPDIFSRNETIAVYRIETFTPLWAYEIELCYYPIKSIRTDPRLKANDQNWISSDAN